MPGIDDMRIPAIIDFGIAIPHSINRCIIVICFIFRYIVVDYRFHIFCCGGIVSMISYRIII